MHKTSPVLDGVLFKRIPATVRAPAAVRCVFSKESCYKVGGYRVYAWSPLIHHGGYISDLHRQLVVFVVLAFAVVAGAAAEAAADAFVASFAAGAAFGGGVDEGEDLAIRFDDGLAPRDIPSSTGDRAGRGAGSAGSPHHPSASTPAKIECLWS